MKSSLSFIIADILKEVPVKELHLPKHRSSLEHICNNHTEMIIISILPSMLPVFISENGIKYSGMKLAAIPALGMKLFSRILHPDNLSVISAGLAHFTQKPAEDFSHTYRVRSADMGWRWVYGTSRAINLEADNSAGAIVTILIDIENNLQENKVFRRQPVIKGFHLTEEEKTLTIREREVFRLMCLGMIEKDIALKMQISKHTVHAHRKNIYRKLHVKSFAEAMKHTRHLS